MVTGRVVEPCCLWVRGHRWMSFCHNAGPWVSIRGYGSSLWGPLAVHWRCPGISLPPEHLPRFESTGTWTENPPLLSLYKERTDTTTQIRGCVYVFHHFQNKNHSQQAVTEALQPLSLENNGGGGSSSRLVYSLESIGWRKLLGQPSLHDWQVSSVGRRESNTFPSGYLDRMSNMLSRVSQTPRWRVGLGWFMPGADRAPIPSIPILTFSTVFPGKKSHSW